MGAGQRVLILLAITFVYLFAGASVFSAIESAHEERTRLDLSRHLEDFLERNPCLNASELRELLREVHYAASIGVETVAGGDENGSAPTSSHWDLANAFFFSATVITTIGYGHLSPATSAGQNFCIVYAYVGIPLMAVLLTEISSKWKQRLVNVGLSLNTRLVNVLQRNRLRQAVIILILVVPAYVIVVVVPAVIFSYIEGWDFLVAHYYCFISLSTIGLGDYVATQRRYDSKALVWAYKIGTSLYLIAGLGVMAIVFHGVQTKRRRRSGQSFSKRLANVVRRHKKQWLHAIGEQADRMAEGFPVEAGVISSSVAAAAVAAVVSHNNNDDDAMTDSGLPYPAEDGPLYDADPIGSSSDNDDVEDAFQNLEYLNGIHPSSYYLPAPNPGRAAMFRNPHGFTDDLADGDDENQEEETSFMFLDSSPGRRADVCRTPDSDSNEDGGGEDGSQATKAATNDLDHPKLAGRPVLPHRLDLCNFAAGKRSNDLTPETNRSQPHLAQPAEPTRAELRGVSAKLKLWSPSSSQTWEDSGIHAASSQSTIDMETTV